MEEEKILEVLCSCGQCTMAELKARLASVELQLIRRIISELLRQGIIEKRPDYSKNKLVYVPKKAYCSEKRP